MRVRFRNTIGGVLTLAVLGAAQARADVVHLAITGVDDPDAGHTLATAWRTFANS